MLLLVTLAYPLAASVLGALVLRSVVTLMLLSALYAVLDSKRLFRVMAGLLVPTIAATWLLDPGRQPALSSIAQLVVMAVFVVTLAAILRDIITSKQVTADVIFGSVAVYLLFGVILALAYYVLNLLDPGSAVSSISERASAAEHHDQMSEFLYFSFITLTSVGYGDIAPVGPAARGLAIFEGIFGQLYVAILIARLVSIHIAQK